MHIIEIDITDDSSVEQAIKSLVGLTGRLDVVVNNAGIAYMGPLEAFTLEQAQQQFDTNVFGVLRVNRAALPHMRRQGSGLLLQIGSIAGRLALPFQGLYAATKFALEALTESYRSELAPFGIDAAILEPGTYPTPIETKQQSAADTKRAALYQAALDAFTTPLFAENRSATPPDPQEVATPWPESSPNQRESDHCTQLLRRWPNVRLPRRSTMLPHRQHGPFSRHSISPWRPLPQRERNST